MTKGGLETTRPKRSPATGSVERACAQADAGFRAVRIRVQFWSVEEQVKTSEGERPFRNVRRRYVFAVMQQVERLMPQPVLRSVARCVCCLMVVWTKVVDARPIPST